MSTVAPNDPAATTPPPGTITAPATAPAAALDARRDTGAMLLLAGMVAVSRLATVAAMPGEQDSALFTVGLWRWISTGPKATLIYDRQFSPGYYWFMAHLARAFHVTAFHYLALLNGVSVLAAIATAPLAYRVARAWLRPVAAFWATLLWMLSPAVWWTGIEPHPQALAMLLTLAALVAHRDWALRRLRAAPGARATAWAGVFLLLLASLLIRSDAVLLYGAFFLPWVARPERRPPLRAAAGTAAVLAAAVGAFFLLRMAMLGAFVDPSGVSDFARIDDYLGHLSLLAQGLPFVMAAGAAALALALLGWMALPARRRRRWLFTIALWTAPGAVFWFLVRGNNVRHVALLLLPLLWAGADGWQRLRLPRGLRRAHPVAVVAALALVLDAAVPVSANVTLYPTGDVPMAAWVLRRDQRQLFALGAQLAAQPGACYLGSYTSPYVLLATLRTLTAGARPQITLPPGARTQTTWVRGRSGAPPITFHDIYSPSEYLAAARACPRSSSLEYSPTGQKLHPFGLAWLYRR